MKRESPNDVSCCDVHVRDIDSCTLFAETQNSSWLSAAYCATDIG